MHQDVRHAAWRRKEQDVHEDREGATRGGDRWTADAELREEREGRARHHVSVRRTVAREGDERARRCDREVARREEEEATQESQRLHALRPVVEGDVEGPDDQVFLAGGEEGARVPLLQQQVAHGAHSRCTHLPPFVQEREAQAATVGASQLARE